MICNTDDKIVAVVVPIFGNAVRVTPRRFDAGRLSRTVARPVAYMCEYQHHVAVRGGGIAVSRRILFAPVSCGDVHLQFSRMGDRVRVKTVRLCRLAFESLKRQDTYNG